MTYIKKFLSQSGARALGLEDIELEMDKDIEFPCYGLPFAEKVVYEDGVCDYTTYFTEDGKCSTFEETLAYKLLIDPKISTPLCHVEDTVDEKGNKITIEKYKLLYINPNASVFKPTVLYTYSRNKNAAHITCEFLFVFEDEWIFTYEQVFEVTNINVSPFDFILDAMRDLENFKDKRNFFLTNSPACEIKEIDGEPVIELEVCNLKGEFSTLDYSASQWREFINSFCSVRIIEVEEEGKNYLNLGRLGG